MNDMLRQLKKGFFEKDHFLKRLITVLCAVIMMGFSLTWLRKVDLGTDPCTQMNLAISAHLPVSFGTWQAFINVVVLILVLILGARNIGFGTLANMFLVGYLVDLFTWIFSDLIPVTLPDTLMWRLGVLLPALLCFIIAAAVYMDCDMGTAPYDAMSMIISDKLNKIPFFIIRILYDLIVIVIGLLFGAKFGIVTFLMALTLGPAVTLVGKWMKRFLL